MPGDGPIRQHIKHISYSCVGRPEVFAVGAAVVVKGERLNLKNGKKRNWMPISI